MPTRKFKELVDKMPEEAQHEVAKRIRQSLASMPPIIAAR